MPSQVALVDVQCNWAESSPSEHAQMDKFSWAGGNKI